MRHDGEPVRARREALRQVRDDLLVVPFRDDELHVHRAARADQTGPAECDSEVVSRCGDGVQRRIHFRFHDFRWLCVRRVNRQQHGNGRDDGSHDQHAVRS
jgi:hypothetical protein